MRAVNNSILRSILGILLGLLLILWPETAVTYLAVMIGVFFILPGLYSLLVYLFRDKKQDEYSNLFPIIAIGSILLGVWLVAMPDFFAGALMFLLGGILVIAGCHQIYFLVRARKWTHVPFVFHLLPSIILITGVMILIYPFEAAKNTFVVFGVASLLYGINELVNWIKFRKRSSKKSEQTPPVEIIDISEE